MNINLKARLKNPVFWITLGALFLSTTRIDPTTLTNWVLLKDAILGVLLNPYLLICFILAVIGQFNNPTTPGLKDK